jgi:hypothetical protein
MVALSNNMRHRHESSTSGESLPDTAVSKSRAAVHRLLLLLSVAVSLIAVVLLLPAPHGMWKHGPVVVAIG